MAYTFDISDNRRIVEALKTGDEETFKEVYTAFCAPLRHYATTILHRGEEGSGGKFRAVPSSGRPRIAPELRPLRRRSTAGAQPRRSRIANGGPPRRIVCIFGLIFLYLSTCYMPRSDGTVIPGSPDVRKVGVRP